jgi:hypothetical protein
MSKQYVQHRSGDVEKYELVPEDNCPYAWRAVCTAPGYETYFLYLPKSDYRLCDPPKVWTDVTSQLVDSTDVDLRDGCEWSKPKGPEYVVRANRNGGYRLRKVQHGQFGWALKVEQREVQR